MADEMDMQSPVPGTSIRGAVGAEANRRIVEHNYDFEDWKINVMKSTILPSNCYCSNLSDENLKVIVLGSKKPTTEGATEAPGLKCQVCRFSELPLKHLPEMVFPDNNLRLLYKPTGFALDFNTLEAMKMIPVAAEPIHVACSSDWQASKAETGLPTEAAHSFNWTFSTDYRGTIHVGSENGTVGHIEADAPDHLDLEKLKQREKILFFEEMTLYEDELHDNGVSNLTAKIRVMPSGFFVLLRFFLRVDNVMARMCDTRIHFEVGNNYFLREFQVREETFKNLASVEPSVFSDPNMLYTYLPLVRKTMEKIGMTAP